MKLCPFCGVATGQIRKWKQKDKVYFRIYCHYCGAEAGKAHTIELAKHNWNKRITLTNYEIRTRTSNRKH